MYSTTLVVVKFLDESKVHGMSACIAWPILFSTTLTINIIEKNEKLKHSIV